MISEALEQYAREHYTRRLSLLNRCREEAERIEKGMEACSREERVLMEFFYGTMPFRDAGEYDFSVFLGFVRHALMLREEMEWCRLLPEDIFLHHVLYYRINNESIQDCRPFFYDQLIGRIQGKSMEEAVLEINYWCGENGTYELTDDRTMSPMAMYLAGRGRCGEESTFAVTALRSVGIPARQVYTPRWAHCDDNHAWVEAYVDGHWRFFGACEPEEVLDQGWFTHAASRALLIHTQTFSDYCTEPREEYLGQEAGLFTYNQTAAYARTKRYGIQVFDQQQRPVRDVKISVEILNMAEYKSGATLYTDEEGKAAITLGLGDIHIWAEKDGCAAEAVASVKDTEQAVLILSAEKNYEEWGEGWIDLDIKAPADGTVRGAVLTREQRERKSQRIKAGQKLRKQRISSYFQETLAEAYPKERMALASSGGNFLELYRFLSRDGNPDRRALFSCLSAKDYRDAEADVLESHLKGAAPFRREWEEKGELEIYRRYILCPRIGLEELKDYRGWIQGYFTEEEKQKFRENPEEIWRFIQANIRYEEAEDHPGLISSPACSLRLLWGDALSRNILFVGICRTLGIPARLNPVNRTGEWMRDGEFISVGRQSRAVCGQPAVLILHGGEKRWNYYHNWTMGKLENAHIVTLDYQGAKFQDGQLKLELEAGMYRLLTTSRLPNGNQKASQYWFSVKAGERREIAMRLREGRAEEMLVDIQLDDFELIQPDGKVCTASSLCGRETAVIACFGAGEEPSEHVLNEMLEQKEELKRFEGRILFVLSQQEDLEHSTIQKVLEEIPGIQVVYGSFEEVVEPLARRLYTDPDQLPLLLLLHPGLRAVYGRSGYHVGSVEAMVKLLQNRFNSFHLGI